MISRYRLLSPKPGGFSCAALCAMFFLTLMLVRPAKADPYREVALSISQKLVALFPAAEGYVVSLPEGEVYVDLTEGDLVRPGMELLVYREGTDIVHPVTGDILGKYEEKLGFLTLKEVKEKYSVGQPAERLEDLKAGDRVRISARPLRALLLFAAEAPSFETGRMAQVLRESTDESKRFRLQDEPEWFPRLKELELTIDEVLSEAARLRRLGDQARADLMLILTPPVEQTGALGLEVVSLWTGRILAEVRLPWVPSEAEPALEDPKSQKAFRLFPGITKKPSPREYVTKDFPSAALSLLAGPFTGEGNVDILVTDGHRLTMYTWKESGLIWKWEDEGSSALHVLNLEKGDLDEDGRPEVLVTRVAQGRLQTEVLSWGQGEWDSLGKAEGVFLRVFPRSEGGALVVGQRFGVSTVLAGPVMEYDWREGRFRTDGGWRLPRGVDIFGLELADLDDDGREEILSLDSEGYIRVLTREGKELYQGGDHLGGYPNRIKPLDLFGPRLVDGGIAQGFFTDESTEEQEERDVGRDIRNSFKGRIVAGDTGEAALTVAVPDNYSGSGEYMPNLRRFNKGTAVLLEWEDGRLVEARRSRKMDGYIADMALADLDGDGGQEILLAVNRLTGVLLRHKGTLVVWSPERAD